MLAKHSNDMHPALLFYSTEVKKQMETYRGAATKLEVWHIQFYEAIAF